eukprot:scaffold114267_cov66-Phaeocystis_antarctica.AAC.3
MGPVQSVGPGRLSGLGTPPHSLRQPRGPSFQIPKALSASHSVEADKACRQGLPTRPLDLGIECIAALEAGAATDAASCSPSTSLSGATARRRGFRPSTMTRCGGPPSS